MFCSAKVQSEHIPNIKIKHFNLKVIFLKLEKETSTFSFLQHNFYHVL